MTPLARAAASARLLSSFDEMWVLLTGEDSESTLFFAGEGTQEETVFNYPTLAEAYKVAALDGLNRVEAGRGSRQEPFAGAAS